MVTKVKTKTNTTTNSCTPVSCTCEELWSVSQQFCLKRLSEEVSVNSYNFVDSYSVRARRIAGTYARFYLETEENGDQSKKGRFYWMALGAFASKTVACTLEHWTLTSTKHGIVVTASDWFGQGNFWLFQDIAGWHHYYSKFGPEVFFNCMSKRNTNTLVPEIKSAIDKADWAKESLSKINNLKSNDFIKKGFSEVKKFERIPSTLNNKSLRAIAQYQNVLIIAEHEQGEILQPLIYEGWRNRREIDSMGLFSWFTPEVALFFTSDCSTNTGKYTSRSPEGTVVYDYESRMDWIRKAAEKFHGLMQNESTYMETQLQTMAGWYNKADRWINLN